MIVKFENVQRAVTIRATLPNGCHFLKSRNKINHALSNLVGNVNIALQN
jgi:hypothetical protein